MFDKKLNAKMGKKLLTLALFVHFYDSFFINIPKM